MRSMLLLVILAFLCARIGSPCQAETLLGSWHFQGSRQISHMDGGHVLKSVLEEESSMAVVELLVKKLASAPDQLFYGIGNSAHSERVAILQPIMADLIAHESYGEVHGIIFPVLNLSMAIRLTDEKQLEWNQRLRRHAAHLGWDIHPPLSEGFTSNWEASPQRSGQLMRFGQAGEWLIISVGSDVLTQWTDWQTAILSDTFPPKPTNRSWLSLQMEVDSLAHFSGHDSKPTVERVRVDWSGDGDHIRTTGFIQTKEELDETGESWSIPVNRIVDPVISFSTQRNLAPLISSFPGVKKLFADSIPKQSVAWSKPSKVQNPRGEQQTAPWFLNYITWPVQEDQQSVMPIQERAKAWLGESFLSNRRVDLVGNAEANHVVMKITPGFVQPFVQGYAYENQFYQMAGLTFVNISRTNPPPAALLGQIENHPRLRYYHWELTGEKVFQYRNLLNLGGFLFGKGQMLKDSPLFSWTVMLENRLGNAVTQLLRKNERTLEIKRKSHFGLTGFEIAVLARWMHADVFPWIHGPSLLDWQLADLQSPGP